MWITGDFSLTINIGWSDIICDACILRNTELFQKMPEGTLFPDEHIHVHRVAVQIVILEDPTSPLLPCLRKPFTGHLDSSRARLNYCLSRCKMAFK